MSLVDVRSPIRPDIRADMTATGAHHARPERPDARVIRQMIGIHCRAVAAIDRAAIDEQISAAVGTNVPQGHRFESLVFLDGH
jgi:hypothetical protein